MNANAALPREVERAADTDAALDDATRRSMPLQSQADADARQADADAVVAERAAKAKAAQLHTTRGDYGSSSSLRTFWDFADLDRAASWTLTHCACTFRWMALRKPFEPTPRLAGGSCEACGYSKTRKASSGDPPNKPGIHKEYA